MIRGRRAFCFAIGESPVQRVPSPVCVCVCEKVRTEEGRETGKREGLHIQWFTRAEQNGEKGKKKKRLKCLVGLCKGIYGKLVELFF